MKPNKPKLYRYQSCSLILQSQQYQQNIQQKSIKFKSDASLNTSLQKSDKLQKQSKKSNAKHRLFLSDAVSASDMPTLKKNQIRTIISIGEESTPKLFLPTISYHSLQLHDKQSQNIEKYFNEIIFKIDKGRHVGNVLIHCYHGVSRSASFVIVYVMAKKGLGYQQAYNFVKERRSCISPNMGFRAKMIAYANKLKGNVKQEAVNQKIQQKTKIQTKNQQQ